MPAPKKATHVVTHRKLYMAQGGKTQLVPAGTEIALTEKQAKKLRDKVMVIGDKKTVDLTPKDDKALAPEAPKG